MCCQPFSSDPLSCHTPTTNIMYTLGVGVDILHLPRLSALLARRKSPSHFAKRILSPSELTPWLHTPSTQYLAVRWAVKEAAYKAAYPYYSLTWKQLEFLKNKDSPKPFLHSPSHPNLRFHASISHDADYVVAIVLAQHSTPLP